MRGLQICIDPRRIGRPLPAAQWPDFTQAGKANQVMQCKVWRAGRPPWGGQVEVPPEQLLEVSWIQFFADTTKLWGNRQTKPPSLHPTFRHKFFKVPFWSSNQYKPVWIDSHSATMGVELKATPEAGSGTIQWAGAFAAPKTHVKVAMCRKLCQDGAISDAVRALDLLVQRGCHVPSSLYHCVLKRCAKNKDLALGRRIHALAIGSGYEGDAFLATHLIGLYASHGKLEEAMGVFNTVAVPDAYNWATIIFAYARHGGAIEAAEAIRLYRQMCKFTLVKPDDRLYLAVLKACAAAEDVVAGKEVHARIIASSQTPDKFVQAALINMYAKCGSLVHARRVFDALPEKDVVTWTSMIAGYVQQEMGPEALNLYRCMQQEGFSRPNSFTYACLLQACGSTGTGALDEGKQLHAEIKKRGLEENVVLAVSLVHMYVKCGSLEDARKLFEKLPERDVVTWTAMMAGYNQQGRGQEALGLYRSMQQEGIIPNSVTYVCLLQACASMGVRAFAEGKRLHREIEEQGLQDDVTLCGSLVHMYAKSGCLLDARKIFDKLSYRNIVAWTAMISGYARQGMGQEALSLYTTMQKEGLTPHAVTYVCLLQACASVGIGAYHVGKQLHAQIENRGLQKDAVLGGSLINMYAKCGSLDDARRIFHELPEKNVVAWNAIIAGYAQHRMGQEALRLYNSMEHEGLSPNFVTYVCVLQACASVGVGALHVGKQLHVQIKERGLQVNAVIGGSLVNMYARCGSMEDACRLFDQLADKNVVAWNAMIAGYAQKGMGEGALALHRRMQQDGVSPDPTTYVSLLQACASIGVGALYEGKLLHAEIEKRGLMEDAVLGRSLVNMYAKCGSVEDAHRLFVNLLEKDVEAWNAMIAGYAQQGQGHKALSLYCNMQQEGHSPNSVTYVCLLQACASVGEGALTEGKQLHAQIEERGLEGDAVLGGSLVNMYAKCGTLEEARRIFDKLHDRNIVAWTAMIAGYVQQGMGQEALSLYSSMQKHGINPNSVTYICLLQACADVAALPLGEHLHTEMEERGMQANGCVGAALVNMYAKCGSICDAQRVFDLMSEKNLEAWNSLLCGYARQGDSQVVFDLLVRMRVEGILPNEVTFLGVLTVCSHVGLVNEGREFFEAMTRSHGISATMDHYICMVDLLGRAGHLHEALLIAKRMPFPPNDVVWHTLLGACRKWKNVEIGQQAFKGAITVDEKDPTAYVLMSNIYASSQMWEAAKEMKARRMTLGAWKKPGKSWWTDMGGVVHTFLAGDKKHTESEFDDTQGCLIHRCYSV